MVSREPLAGLAGGSEGSQEKAMTVRSVLLNRDSPDVESRLKRRRSRTQQVRFKDLVEGGGGQAASPTPGLDTPRASPPPRVAPEPAALCASRRSWPQSQPGSLTLPMPRKVCMSTAIQTSPSLQKPFPASQPRSKSVCNVAGDTVLPTAATGSARCPGGTVPTGASRAVPTQAPGSFPMRDHVAALPQSATVCRVPPPLPPRDPCPPYPGTAGCPVVRCTSPAPSSATKPCPLPPACARLRGNRGGSREGLARPASVPCGQPWPPTEPRGLGRSDSERSLPRWHPSPQSSPQRQNIPATDSHGLHQPPQDNPPWDSPQPQHQLCHTPWRGPCCTLPAPIPPGPGWHGTATMPEKTPAVLSHLDPHGICSRLHAAKTGHNQAGPEGPGEPLPPVPQGPGVGTQPAGRAPEVLQHGQTCLTTEQSETLRHVQDLLQLVVVTKGPVGPPAGDEDNRTSQGEQGDLQSQLQSLEGVLETSQQTIRVLLDVIQDLEKKEAQRDGRHSYRTGQDIANCGTCRDCACIIYSVEHDFRQQEGRFQQVLSHIEEDVTLSSPMAGAAGATSPPRQEPSPVPKLPTKLDVKKSRRKCFWFL